MFCGYELVDAKLLTVQNKDQWMSGRWNTWNFFSGLKQASLLEMFPFSRKNFNIVKIVLKACVTVIE